MDHELITFIKETIEIKFQFFHFYFLNMDILLDIQDANSKSTMQVNNIHLEGTVWPNTINFRLILEDKIGPSYEVYWGPLQTDPQIAKRYETLLPLLSNNYQIIKKKIGMELPPPPPNLRSNTINL